MRILILVALVVVTAPHAAAQLPFPTPRQDSLRPQDTVPVPRFRVAPPISPLGAAGRSLLIPGWGQAALGRRITGAAFVFWEGLTVGMTIKSVHQLSYLESIGDSARIEGKRQELQDWVVLLVFNHLFAGAEAFVSAYLWDFPVDLETRALPSGFGVGLRIGGRD